MKRLLIFMLFILPLAMIDCGGLPGEALIYGGHILLDDSSPLEGIEVVFFMPDPPNPTSDGTWVVLTNVDGWYSNYQYTAWEDRDFSITPSHPAYIFTPTGYSFPGAYEDHLNLDFTAIPVIQVE